MAALSRFGSRFDKIMRGEKLDTVVDKVAAMSPQERNMFEKMVDALGEKTQGARDNISSRFQEAKGGLEEQARQGGNIFSPIGDAIADIDRAYAAEVGKAFPNRPGVSTPIFMDERGPVPYATGYGPIAPDVALDRARVSNIMSRYALPVGGVTLAGVGLMDIVDALRGPEPGTLPM